MQVVYVVWLKRRILLLNVSGQCHLAAEPRENVSPPLKIDVCDPFDRWGLKHDTYDFMFNANMVHISPWKCTESLFANAGEILRFGKN